MDQLARDIRYAVRLLWKSPAFTLTAVVCLGLGIGANTALFGIFNSLLWKPLPVQEPERLVRVYAKGAGDTWLYLNFSYPEMQDYRGKNDVLSGLAATTGAELGFRTAGTDPMRVFGEVVTDNYFEVLGIGPRMGRVFVSRHDGSLRTVPEVVLSHRFWERRLHSDPAIIGKTVWLSGAAFTVAGVMPPAFKGTASVSVFAPDLWLPIGTLPQIDPSYQAIFQNRASRALNLIGRLKPGVSVPQAQVALRTIAARLERSYPESNRGVTALVFRELDTRPEVYNARPVNLVAVLFLAFSALVLLVACANLANLLLARAGARQKEIALRLALGAGRPQLVRQLLIEAVVLALVAGGVGLLVGYGVSRAVSAVSLPGDLPIVFDPAIDTRAMWFTLAISLVAGVAFGLVPALRASRPDLVPALKDGSWTAGGRRRRLTLANALVVAQVTVSLVLLVAAGLFWRSVAGARTIDPGLDTRHRALVSFSPSLVRDDALRTSTFYRALLDRLSQVPEVERAALASWVPLGFQLEESRLIIQGGEARPDQDKQRALVNVITPGYLEAMGVPIRRGRGFTDQDDASALPVVMVNQTLARLAWPGQDPIGQRLQVDGQNQPWLTVVGVVADGKYRTLREPPQPYMLRPFVQQPTSRMTLVVKSARDDASALAAVRREVQAVDPSMPLLDVKTMEQHLQQKVFFEPRAMAALAGPVALLAMVIASLGLYGVMAYSVSRRTREIGIRLAIGAKPRDVARMVMTQGLTIVAVGVGLGGPAALGVGRVMRRVLVGVAPTDALAFAGALALLAVVAVLATYLPARRASRVDPLVALRQE